MKKYFSLAAFAFAAIALVSCNKDDNGKNEGGNDDNSTSRKVLYALPSELSDEGELISGRTFRYNEDGSLAGVDEVWLNDDGTQGSYNLNVSRSGNKLTLTTDEGTVEYEWTVNDKGYITEAVSGESTYTYEYDNDGHLVKVSELWDGETYLASVITWENGNLVSWTKEGYFDDGSARVKKQTYTDDLNTGGIHTVFTEKGATKKWMFEAGFFGVASKNLVATDKWEDNEKGAKFEYRTDDDDYVIAEVKYYGNETEGYEVDNETYYIWQE